MSRIVLALLAILWAQSAFAACTSNPPTSCTNPIFGRSIDAGATQGDLAVVNTLSAANPKPFVPFVHIDALGNVTLVIGVNTIALNRLAQSAANTMLGNWTGATANVSANAMPSCPDSSGNHLNYVSGTGITCGVGLGAAITALTGDISATGPGSVAATLATVNTNVGAFGSSTAIPNFTVNAKGLITAAGTSAVIAPAGTLTGTTLAAGVTGSSLTSVGTLSAGAVPTTLLTGTLQAAQEPAHTGDVTNTAGALALTLATVNANVGSFGSSTAIPNFTVNAKGLLTAAGTSAVVAPAGTLTGATLAAGVTASSLTSVGTLSAGAVPTTLLTGTLQAAQEPAHTGDVTNTAGALALTLATVNANVGAFGSSTAIPNFTVNAKGLLTAAGTSVVVAPAGTLTGATLAAGVTASSLTSVGTLASGAVPTALLTGTLQAAQEPAHTGDVTNTAGALALTLATVNANVGSFGSSTAIPNFTVNAKGLITAAGTSVVVAPAGTLTGSTLPTGLSAPSFTVTTAFTATGLVTNADLVNASTTVNSQTCTLGSTCTVTAVPGGSAGGDLAGSYPNPTVANLTTGVTVAGTMIHTNIVAPATPAAGKNTTWSDSTDLRLHDKNASGVIGTTVVADTGAGNNFLTAISSAGAISKARPTCGNLSDSSTGCSTTVGTMATQNASAVAITGGTIAGLTGLAVRDTSAAFDVTLATVSSTALTAGRTLTVDMVNGARTLKLGASLTLASDPGAVTGALKSNGTGTFAQAACADLSNGATGCSTATGTSGATIPLLNGTNTWSAVNTFNSGDLSTISPVFAGTSTGTYALGGTLTINAHTLGGTLSGAGNQINNVIIGTSTPLAGSFTTLTASTSITSPLHIGGTAASSTLTLESTSGTGTTDSIVFATGSQVTRMTIGSLGTIGIGVAPPANAGIAISPTTMTTTFQEAIVSTPTCTTAATGACMGFYISPITAAGSYTTTSAYDVYIADFTKGASNVITTQYGIYIEPPSQGVTNYPIYSAGGQVYFGGSLSVGTTSAPGAGAILANTSVTATTTLNINGIASDAAQTDSTVCINSSGRTLKGSGTLGICLGTSSARYKTNIVPETEGLTQLAALEPKNFRYIKGYGDEGAREQYGFLAEDVIHVLPKLVSLDKDGRPNSVDLLGMVPIIIRAVQELKSDNDNLRAEIRAIQKGLK